MDRIDIKTTENQLRQEFIQGYVQFLMFAKYTGIILQPEIAAFRCYTCNIMLDAFFRLASNYTN